MKYFDKDHRVGDDSCAIETEIQQNDKISNYMLFNNALGVSECDNLSKKTENMNKLREFATENNLRIRDGYGVINPCNIDEDSSMRIDRDLIRDKSRTQMFSRTFQAVPNLSRGNVNIDNESKIQQGNNTWNLLNCDEKQQDNFIPMIPCLANNIQNPNNIIQNWTRGGETTRDTIKQQEFLEKSGYVFDKECLKH